MADVRSDMRIEIQKDGPYTVHGDIRLVRKEQVVSEYGEPLTWKTGDVLPAQGEYELCRCGKSGDKPFCDQTHSFEGFDGTETADAGPTAERQVVCEGGTHIVVKRDHSICAESGFCGNRVSKIRDMVPHTDDTQVRAQVMAMIERCPSGSFVYALEERGPDIEPDLPVQIGVTTEITSNGPIEGPLWVSGGIPVQRADGQLLETRNRVTLCRCGLSQNKPLCDGTHRPKD